MSRSPNRLRLPAAATAVLAILVGSLAYGARPAEAVFYSGGLGYSNINIKTVSVASYWDQALDRSAANWNASGAGTRIRRDQSSAAYLTAGQYSTQSWYGYYNPFSARTGQTPGTICYDRVFGIQINAYRIERATPSRNWDTWNISVITHEIGHALSLWHTDANVTSIMNDDRNRTSIYTPQAVDVTDVRNYNTPGCGG